MHAPPARPIRLYRYRLSGHAHRVEAFLAILGLPYERVEIDIRAGEQRAPAFLALNPAGQVPVIEDDGLILADSNAILVYLALAYAPESWVPRAPAEAAKVQRWLSLAAGPVAAGLSAARRSMIFGRGPDAAAQDIGRRFLTQLEPALEGGVFLVGEAPTIADLALYAYIARAPEGGLPLAPYPAVRAWLDRVERLPGFLAMPVAEAG